MNKSEIPTTELETPKEENNNIRFIKNEEGKRIWQKLKDSEVELMKRNKELGVVITGHMGNSAEIIDALTKCNFQGETLLIIGKKTAVIEKEILEELEKEVPTIKEDIIKIFKEKDKKNYHTDFKKYRFKKQQIQKPKIQKYFQRKIFPKK